MEDHYKDITESSVDEETSCDGRLVRSFRKEEKDIKNVDKLCGNADRVENNNSEESRPIVVRGLSGNLGNAFASDNSKVNETEGPKTERICEDGLALVNDNKQTEQEPGIRLTKVLSKAGPDTVTRNVCPKSSRSKRKRRKPDLHAKEDVPEKPEHCRTLFCNICQRWFSTPTQMNNHNCNSNLRYVCEHCGKGFQCYSGLKVHCNTHTRTEVFTCGICHKTFLSFPSLRNHLGIHHQPRNHVCQVCQRAFRYKAELRYHSLVHEKKSQIVFHKIGDCYKKEWIDRNKASTAVSDKPNTELPFANREKLRHDMTADDLTKTKPLYRCHLCLKEFSLKTKYRKHTRCHEESSVLMCRVCNEIFGSKAELAQHVRTHNRPFRCKICGASFDRSEVAKRHLLTHSDDRPFQCAHCQKSFKTKSNWKRHEKQFHEGSVPVKTYPYTCCVCDKKIQYAHHLRRHMKTHTSDKPHLCQKCGRSFAEEHHLRRHQLVHGDRT